MAARPGRGAGSRYSSRICLLAFLVAGSGCSADLAAEREALLELHERARVAHLEGDPELLISMFADDIVMVNDGRVQRPTREESLQRFSGYLESVRFLEWSDISPPVIRISDDGTMAYVIVQKRVRLVTADSGPDTEQEQTVFAWTETYEKRGGVWKITSVTSTDRPGGDVR